MKIEGDLALVEQIKTLKYGNILKNYYKIDENGTIINSKRNSIVKPHLDKDGYLTLSLCTNENIPNRDGHIRKAFRVATLVGRTFIGNPPKKISDPTIDHIDGCRTNNHFSNLRWIERSTNSSIRQNKGQGELNHEAILKEKDVHKICKMLSDGMSLSTIASIFGVKRSTINNIRRRKAWTYITNQYLW